MKRTHLLSILSVFYLLLFTGCSKLVQIPPPVNQIVSSQVFADSADATAAVLGIYSKFGDINSIGASLAVGGVSLYTGLAADELYPTVASANYVDESQFYTNALVATNSTNSGYFWSPAYQTLYLVNACIEGLDTSSHLVFASKKQLQGEVRVIRALFYFNLVNLYGGVPLVVTTNYEVNAKLPNASVDAIYQQIIDDLVTAQGLLQTNYPSTGRVRPNLYTATALLARVYLYRKQWAQAEVAATTVINSGMYSLSPLNTVFLSNIATPANKEPLWQFMSRDLTYGNETIEGYTFLPTAAIPKYVIDSFLYRSFENGDKRQTNWLKFTTFNGQTYYYPYKYKLGYDGNTTPLESYVILRLAEQYLIRAEAIAQQGSDLNRAAADVDTIRSRAGLLPIPVTTQQALLTAIYHERQTELFCEWGHRWYDLKRTGQIDAVMGGPKGICAAKGGTWDSRWQLFPIPNNEVLSDPFLIQNSGY